MKKKLQLSTLIKVQKNLEKLISAQQEFVLSYNDTEIKISETLVTMLQTEENLAQVKEVIQEANKLKHEDGKTNNYYIYRLSNLNARKRFLNTIQVNEKSQLTRDEINKLIAELDSEINSIRTKLKEFNLREVVVELDEKVLNVASN
jgi:hypothetical protein